MPTNRPSIKQFRSENERLRRIVMDFHTYARRYCDGRMTTSTSTFNSHTRELLSMGLKPNTCDGIIWATDGNGRRFDGLTEAQATPGTPDAKGESPMTDAERCRKNGWSVGARLIGTECKGTDWEDTTVIEITAIGEQRILAKRISSTRQPDFPNDHESDWSLADRKWSLA